MGKEAELDTTDILTYPLSNGVELSLWTSLYNQPGEPAYFWALFTTDELPQIWYKCHQENDKSPEQWKSFKSFNEVCTDVEEDDDSPQLGAAEVLDEGRYILQTKVLYKGKSFKPTALTFIVEPSITADKTNTDQGNTAIQEGLGEMIDFLKETGDYSEEYLQGFHDEMKQAYCTPHPCMQLQEKLDKKDNTPFEDSVDQLFLAFMNNNCTDDSLESFIQTVQTDRITSLLNKVITIGGPQDYMDDYKDSTQFFAFIDFISAVVISVGESAIAKLNEYEDSKVNTHYIHYIKKFVNDDRFHSQLQDQFPFFSR